MTVNAPRYQAVALPGGAYVIVDMDDDEVLSPMESRYMATVPVAFHASQIVAALNWMLDSDPDDEDWTEDV